MVLRWLGVMVLLLKYHFLPCTCDSIGFDFWGVTPAIRWIRFSINCLKTKFQPPYNFELFWKPSWHIFLYLSSCFCIANLAFSIRPFILSFVLSSTFSSDKTSLHVDSSTSSLFSLESTSTWKMFYFG